MLHILKHKEYTVCNSSKSLSAYSPPESTPECGRGAGGGRVVGDDGLPEEVCGLVLSLSCCVGVVGPGEDDVDENRSEIAWRRPFADWMSAKNRGKNWW